MTWFKLRCCMCGKKHDKKDMHVAQGPMKICKKCGTASGMRRRRPNRAKVNSDTWQNGPCPHQTTHTERYKKGGRWCIKATCRRCGDVLYSDVVVS